MASWIVACAVLALVEDNDTRRACRLVSRTFRRAADQAFDFGSTRFTRDVPATVARSMLREPQRRFSIVRIACTHPCAHELLDACARHQRRVSLTECEDAHLPLVYGHHRTIVVALQTSAVLARAAHTLQQLTTSVLPATAMPGVRRLDVSACRITTGIHVLFPNVSSMVAREFCEEMGGLPRLRSLHVLWARRDVPVHSPSLETLVVRVDGFAERRWQFPSLTRLFLRDLNPRALYPPVTALASQLPALRELTVWTRVPVAVRWGPCRIPRTLRLLDVTYAAGGDAVRQRLDAVYLRTDYADALPYPRVPPGCAFSTRVCVGEVAWQVRGRPSFRWTHVAVQELLEFE